MLCCGMIDQEFICGRMGLLQGLYEFEYTDRGVMIIHQNCFFNFENKHYLYGSNVKVRSTVNPFSATTSLDDVPTKHL